MDKQNRFSVMCRYMLLLTTLITVGYSHKAEAEEQKYVFGVPPVYSQKVLKEGFEPFIRSLSDGLKVPISVVVSKSYEDLIKSVTANEVQFAILGPVQYVEAKWQYPDLVYLVTTKRTVDGTHRPYYFSNIVVLKDSGITELSQLKNRKFAFIDPHSSSGYRFPRMHFYKQGINPETFFSEVVFAGDHLTGIEQLVAGEVDALSTYDLNVWAAEKRYGKILRIITRIGPIVNLALVATPSVPPEVYSTFKKILINMPQEQLPESLPYTGFSALSDAHYDNVREIVTFPFLDKYAPNSLNTIFNTHDLNKILSEMDRLQYQKKTIGQFIENEMRDGIFTVTGSVSAIVNNVSYGNKWYVIKKAAVLAVGNGRNVYLDKSNRETTMRPGETVSLSGKIIGIKGLDNPVMEIVNGL